MTRQQTAARTVSIAAVIMMGSVFLSRITGMLREMVLANLGGAGGEMDAYVAAFLIPELLNSFLAGGFLSVTFIPIFQKFLTDDDEDGAWRAFSNTITIGSAAFALLLPLAVIFTPNILSFTGIGKQDPQTYALTVRLTRIILPAQIFFYWGAFLMAVQYARKKYFLPALAPLCYNAGIMVGGILLSPIMGIEGFAWGVLGGAFVGNVVVQLPGALSTGMRYRFRFSLFDPQFVKFVKITIPLVLGLGMSFSNEIFFRFFGSFLDSGAVASANYALRTMMILVGVFGQASGVAFYPFLTELAAKHAYGKMSEMLNGMINKIALYLLPLTGIMMALAPQIIIILYEHGKFTQQATNETAPVLVMYLIGAFASSAAILAARPFHAVQNTLLPMIVSTAVSLSSIPLYYILSRRMGTMGLGLASGMAMTAQFLILYLLWGRKYGGFEAVKKESVRLGMILAISAIGAAACYFTREYLNSQAVVSDVRRVQAIFVCAVSSIPSLTIVFVLYELFGLQKLKDSIGGLLRRRKKH